MIEESTNALNEDVDIDCKYKYCKNCLCVNHSEVHIFLHKLCKDYPNCYTKQLRRKEKECEKYEQALDEIEKIVKRTSGECFYDDINNCENCDMNLGGCSAFNLRLIKGIISKAKETNDEMSI